MADLYPIRPIADSEFAAYRLVDEHAFHQGPVRESRMLLLRQLTDIAAKGEPIAALWASESPLYWRYGYGRGTMQASFRFRRGEGALSPVAPVDPALRVRITEPQAAAAELAKVYDHAMTSQSGFPTRNDVWW